MLLEMAIADSYGSGFEYVDPAIVAAHNTLSGYRQHPKWTGLRPGRYTDDTQMALGLAEFLISRKPLTTVGLARAFVAAFKRDPREGYAGKFYDLLKEVRNGTELLQKITPQSNRSGGAMRAGPCGLLTTADDVMDMAMWQASLTHATRDGMNAAAASALMVWACRHGCDRGYLPHFLHDMIPFYPWAIPWQGHVGAPGIDAVRAAVTAIADHPNLSGILHQCVAYTGDTDTVAAIAVAAASMHPQVESDFPDVLVQGLENKAYGREYLIRVDSMLMKEFPVGSSPNEQTIPSTKTEGTTFSS